MSVRAAFMDGEFAPPVVSWVTRVRLVSALNTCIPAPRSLAKTIVWSAWAVRQPQLTMAPAAGATARDAAPRSAAPATTRPIREVNLLREVIVLSFGGLGALCDRHWRACGWRTGPDIAAAATIQAPSITFSLPFGNPVPDR